MFFNNKQIISYFKKYKLIISKPSGLTQVGQFTVDEADSVLACEWDVLNQRVEKNIQYPLRIDTHDLLLARLYARFHSYCQDAMEVCGFEQLEVILFTQL